MPGKIIKRVWELCEPHPDVFARDIDPSLFAVSLHQVDQGIADRDYTDPERYFRKTFMTRSLSHLLEGALGRLCGISGRGAPILRLETPFGGGKTHTMVAFHHLAKHPVEATESEIIRQILEHLNLQNIPKISIAILDGRGLDAKNGREVDGLKLLTLWGELAYRLGGKSGYEGVRSSDEGRTTPGSEKLTLLLQESQPAIILIDELLDYLVKARAIKVGASNLMEQTGVFLQDLTAAVSATPQAVMIVALPASSFEVPEANQEAAERLFQYAKKVLGRMELVETPVAQDEVFGVLRRRLFSDWGDEKEIKKTVSAISDYYNAYARFFPDRLRAPDYRERMIKAYPFHPELVDLLYERWGPHPQFQRTRGALRLLALVIRRLWNQRLGSAFLIQPHHIDLSDRHIRAEAVRLLDSGFDALVTGDILGRAADVDKNLGGEYRREELSKGAATCAFLYSISAATRDVGANEEELRTALLRPDINPAQVSEVLGQLRERLWFLVYRDKRYRFQAKPNLNKVILDYESGLSEEEVDRSLNGQIESISGRGKTVFSVFVTPMDHRAVIDRPEPTLVVLPLELGERAEAEKWILEVARYAGEAYRIHKNMLVFVVPDRGGLPQLKARMRRVLALESIRRSSSFKEMDREDREQVEDHLKDATTGLQALLLSTYSHIYRPTVEGVEEVRTRLTQEQIKAKTIAEMTKAILDKEGILLERISPEYLSEVLKAGQEVSLDQLTSAFLSTPGQPILLNPKGAVSQATIEGIKQGNFGLRVEEKIYFGEDVPVQMVSESQAFIIPKQRVESLKKELIVKEPEKAPKTLRLHVATSATMLYPIIKLAEILKDTQVQITFGMKDKSGALAKKKSEIEKLLKDYGVTFEWHEE